MDITFIIFCWVFDYFGGSVGLLKVLVVNNDYLIEAVVAQWRNGVKL